MALPTVHQDFDIPRDLLRFLWQEQQPYPFKSIPGLVRNATSSSEA